VCLEKDVVRTDRTIDFYSGDNNPNLQSLQEILMTYCFFNFDLGKKFIVNAESMNLSDCEYRLCTGNERVVVSYSLLDE
jgi:hypothetical protein